MDIWKDTEALDTLENQRDTKRGAGVLTFDCMNTVVKRDRVFCSKGKLLGQARDGSLALIVVLRGITSGTCRDCEEYTPSDE